MNRVNVQISNYCSRMPLHISYIKLWLAPSIEQEVFFCMLCPLLIRCFWSQARMWASGLFFEITGYKDGPQCKVTNRIHGVAIFNPTHQIFQLILLSQSVKIVPFHGVAFDGVEVRMAICYESVLQSKKESKFVIFKKKIIKNLPSISQRRLKQPPCFRSAAWKMLKQPPCNFYGNGDNF